MIDIAGEIILGDVTFTSSSAEKIKNVLATQLSHFPRALGFGIDINEYILPPVDYTFAEFEQHVISKLIELAVPIDAIISNRDIFSDDIKIFVRGS